MQNTNSAGKRAESGNQPEKMPAKRTHSKLSRNLLVLLASVVAVAVLVIGMCLIRIHFSTNKSNADLPNNSQSNTELSDTSQNNAEAPDARSDDTGSPDAAQNNAEPPSLGQIVPELLGIWSFNGEATYSFDEHNKGQLVIGEEQYAYSYSASGDELTLDYVDDAVEDAAYQFSVEGNQLTLIGGEGTTGGTYQLDLVD